MAPRTDWMTPNLKVLAGFITQPSDYFTLFGFQALSDACHIKKTLLKQESLNYGPNRAF
jgi:hypothetical protein